MFGRLRERRRPPSSSTDSSSDDAREEPLENESSSEEHVENNDSQSEESSIEQSEEELENEEDSFFSDSTSSSDTEESSSDEAEADSDEVEEDEDLDRNFGENESFFQGIRRLQRLRAPLRSKRGISVLDHLLVALAQAVRFNSSYEELLSKLRWIKESFENANVPTNKRDLWKMLDRDDSNTIYSLYCEECHTLLGNGKVVEQECNCGRCGPLLDKTYVATFVHVRLAPQLNNLLSTPKIDKALRYKQSRVKMDETAIEDIFDGEKYKSMADDEQFLSNPNNLSFTLWTDGASVSKSSKAVMWPVLLQINELSPHARKKNILLAGMWIGKKKPPVEVLLTAIIAELEQLYDTGIIYQVPGRGEVRSRFVVNIFTADSVARTMVLVMKQYNGRYGCTFCLSPGKKIGQRRIYTAETFEMRTHASIIRDSAEAELREEPIKGVKGWSTLANLPLFDLVLGVVVDICHNSYQGVAKQLFLLLMTDVGKEWYIGTPANISTINSRLEKIKTPKRLSRTPRNIENYNLWKSSEWRNWLLYYALPCLDGILKDVYFNHLALLVKALYICNNSSITFDELAEAERCLGKFISQFATYYGEVNMTYNVHLLKHLPNSVRNWGLSWVYNTFSFESMNKRFVDSVTSPHCRAEQMITRFFMRKFVHHAVDEYQVSPGTRKEIEKLLDITARNVPQDMPEGHYFLGMRKSKLHNPQAEEIQVLRESNVQVNENTQLRLFTKAEVHGVHYEVHSEKRKKTCNSIVYCKNVGFISIQKILSFQQGQELVAGFIGKKFTSEQAYNTHLMYVIPTENLVFSSYTSVIAPGIILSNGRRTLAAHLSTCWETD